ncbi:hypothetical protein ACFL0D_03240 [Thermoproteota archaeon]
MKGRETIFSKIVGYPEIVYIFGESWLQSQKENYYFPFLNSRLTELSIAVSKVKEKKIKGYCEWVSNITSFPKEFESFEFEILEISRLTDIAESIEIYPSIEKDAFGYEAHPELKMVRHGIEFYIEMTKFRKASNPKKKIQKLIREKGIKKIPKDSSGFIFVDISDITIRETIHDVEINDDYLINEVEQFLTKKHDKILGILFVISYLSANDSYQVILINRYCPIINRFNKLGLSKDDLEQLIFSDSFLKPI